MPNVQLDWDYTVSSGSVGLAASTSTSFSSGTSLGVGFFIYVGAIIVFRPLLVRTQFLYAISLHLDAQLANTVLIRSCRSIWLGHALFRVTMHLGLQFRFSIYLLRTRLALIINNNIGWTLP